MQLSIIVAISFLTNHSGCYNSSMAAPQNINNHRFVCLVWHLWNHGPKPRKIMVTFYVLMFGVTLSIALIQNSNNGKRFINETICHIWVIWLVLVIHIHFWWPIATTFSVSMCHHIITLSLMIWLKLCWLEIICNQHFDPDWNLYLHDDEISLNDTLVYPLSSWQSFFEWTCAL